MTARQLIAAGVNVDQADEAGATPLFWASGTGQANVVADLLDKGADIDAVMIYAGTPLHAAVVGGHRQVAKILIDRGATINARGLNGTPLMAAATSGDAEMVELLLMNGADVNWTDPNVPLLARTTALDIALLAATRKSLACSNPTVLVLVKTCDSLRKAIIKR